MRDYSGQSNGNKGYGIRGREGDSWAVIMCKSSGRSAGKLQDIIMLMAEFQYWWLWVSVSMLCVSLHRFLLVAEAVQCALVPLLRVQMGPGPNGVGMTLHNLTCGAWDIYNSVFTTQPAVAERLPFPEGAPQITAATKAGPLVQSVKDCASLQVGDAGIPQHAPVCCSFQLNSSLL